MENKGNLVRKFYYALIITFTILYFCIAFVSTLHAITFFQLANGLGLAILLAAAYEIGQAAVLFSILMTKNKNTIMAWLMMFLLTSLQVTANVFASFMYIDKSANNDWEYWQRSILFWVEADSPEMYKIVIAWITGALLPIVALGMTKLVADNIKLQHEKVDLDYDEEEYDDYNEEDEEEYVKNSEKVLKNESYVDKMKNAARNVFYGGDEEKEEAKKVIEEFNQDPEDLDFLKESILNTGGQTKKVESKAYNRSPYLPQLLNMEKVPVNKPRGWHFKAEFVDDDGNVFKKGKYSHSSKKA